eukprot:1096190-Pelagomonas_calceolata.AAC.1
MPVYMGPFEVEHMVGKAAVKLRLPEEWNRIHNVFHVSLTKPSRWIPLRDITLPLNYNPSFGIWEKQ